MHIKILSTAIAGAALTLALPAIAQQVPPGMPMTTTPIPPSDPVPQPAPMPAPDATVTPEPAPDSATTPPPADPAATAPDATDATDAPLDTGKKKKKKK